MRTFGKYIRMKEIIWIVDQIIFDQVVRMADKVGCTVSAPRTVGRQQH